MQKTLHQRDGTFLIRAPSVMSRGRSVEVSRKQNYVRFLPLAIATALCLAQAGFIVVQTQLGAVCGQGIARNAAPASLRLSRSGLSALQTPASLDSLAAAIPVAGAVIPAPELLGQLGQLPPCSVLPTIALAAPSCRAPPSL